MSYRMYIFFPGSSAHGFWPSLYIVFRACSCVNCCQTFAWQGVSILASRSTGILMETGQAELNTILLNNVVRGPHGHLRTFDGIKWECGLFHRKPKALCHPFNLVGHRFRDKNPQVRHIYRIQYRIRYRQLIVYDVVYDVAYDVTYDITYDVTYYVPYDLT